MDPAGTTHQVTIPQSANIQQFIDALVTRLDLPVIDHDDVGIQYWLLRPGSRERLPFEQTFRDLDLPPGSRLIMKHDADAPLEAPHQFGQFTVPDNWQQSLLTGLIILGWIATSAVFVLVGNSGNFMYLFLILVYICLAFLIHRWLG